MRFFIILFAIFILPLSTIYTQERTPEEKMHNAFGHGFQLAKENSTDEAKEYFLEAGQIAKEIQSWPGLIDAGNALRNLGFFDEAIVYFQQALSIASTSNKWHHLVGTAYAFSTIESISEKSASIFKSAAELAYQQTDWVGICEAANGLIQIQKNQDAEKILDLALEIVENNYSIQGAQALSKLYQKIGNHSKFQLCRDLETEFYSYADLGEYQERKIVTPPKGWSPVGDSVAGPPKLDIETQKAIRASADEDIRQKHEYMLQQEKIEAEKINQANSWLGYYYYPYGYSYGNYNITWSSNLISSWGSYYSSYYSYSDGYYSYSGSSYSGFGFGFGYSDSDVSVSFGVYSWN